MPKHGGAALGRAFGQFGDYGKRRIPQATAATSWRIGTVRRGSISETHHFAR